MWSDIADAVIGAFTQVLIFLHDIVAAVPFLAPAAWGWAIILLTVIVRVLLLPLAIKQTRSMRAMQKLQPQIKELQKKYKVDRSLMRKDPEKYRARRQKLNEEMMALYQREGANPAASCLPLLAQAPIFIALFWTLMRADDLQGASFYFFTAMGDGGLEMVIRQAGPPGWLLIVLMSGTMWWSMRQMQARQAATSMSDNPMAAQQKLLQYVMPVVLAVVSINFPIGVVLYWATTNMWQIAQQAIILREVQHETDSEPSSEADGPPAGRSRGATSGTTKLADEPDDESTSTRDAGEGSQDGPPAKPKDEPAKPKDKPSKGKSKRAKDESKPPRGAGDGQSGPSGDANGRRPGGTEDGKQPGEGKPKKRDHLPRRGDRR